MKEAIDIDKQLPCRTACRVDKVPFSPIDEAMRNQLIEHTVYGDGPKAKRYLTLRNLRKYVDSRTVKPLK